MKRSIIEYHLKSAIDSLTPDALSKIDLTTPQDAPPLWQDDKDREEKRDVVSFRKRFQIWGAAAAACICLVLAGNGGYNLYLNQKTDSIIGIDVNPSVELSINRKNKVLEATPLNDDAVVIMEEMELEGVDLNIAVNAVIGSMVTHGYLDDLDNAILVTVTNDSVSKADLLRQEVVEDIEESLKENEVQAVVYDQQVVEKDEVKVLAEEYGISYGKAYFLKELIDQNSSLTLDDMDELSGLTMEEIAARIAESSYSLGERTQKQETSAAETPEISSETETTEETTVTEEETTAEETETTVPETTTAAPTTEPETMVEEEAENRLQIDFVDYEGGILTVYFTTSVKWKDETVSIRGEDGESYAALIEETYSDSCEISVSGLEGGKTYRFSIGGVRQRQDGKPMSVSGTFDVPMISEEATESPDVEATAESTEEAAEEHTEAETTQPPSQGAESSPTQPPESQESPSETERQTEEEPADVTLEETTGMTKEETQERETAESRTREESQAEETHKEEEKEPSQDSGESESAT